MPEENNIVNKENQESSSSDSAEVTQSKDMGDKPQEKSTSQPIPEQEPLSKPIDQKEQTQSAESVPKKILDELDKERQSEIEESKSPLKETEADKDISKHMKVPDEDNLKKVSASQSPDDLISDAMERLDDLLKKIKEQDLSSNDKK